MDTGFEMDIDLIGSSEADKSSIKGKFFNMMPGVAGTTAVLGLVAAFSQNIRDNSVPQEQEQQDNIAVVDKSPGQGIPVPDYIDDVTPQPPKEVPVTAKEFRRVEKRFKDIFARLRVLNPKPKYEPMGDGKFITKWEIPTIMVGRKKYTLEAAIITCSRGVRPDGGCVGLLGSLPDKSWQYITLKNDKLRGEYILLNGKIKLKLYNLKNPEKNGKKVVPNVEAYILKEEIRPDLSGSSFDDLIPETVYRGHKASYLDVKSKALDVALSKLMGKKGVRQKEAAKEAEDNF